MRPWWGIPLLIWVEAWCVALGWVNLMTYRDPDRNRVTRFLSRYYAGVVSRRFALVKSVPEMCLIQGLMMLAIGAFFLIGLAINGFR